MDNNLLLDVKHQGFVNWDVDVNFCSYMYGMCVLCDPHNDWII